MALERLDDFMNHFEDKYENQSNHKESDLRSNGSIAEIQYIIYEESKLSRSPGSYKIYPKKEDKRGNSRKEVKINRMMDDNSAHDTVEREYHSFLNPLEEILFYHYIGFEHELAYIPFNEPLFDLYYLYGTLLFENDDFKEYVKNNNLNIDIEDFEKKYFWIDGKAFRVLIGDGDFKITFEELEGLINYLNSKNHNIRNIVNFDEKVKKYRG